MKIMTENVSVDENEIASIIESIAQATKPYADNSTILGCLATAIVMCYPSVSKTKLGEGVKLMSENLALWIEDENKPVTIH